MKHVFRVPFISAVISSVQAYIVEETGGRIASPFSATEWSAKSFDSKVRIRPLDELAIKDAGEINKFARSTFSPKGHTRLHDEPVIDNEINAFATTDWSPRSFAPKARIRPHHKPVKDIENDAFWTTDWSPKSFAPKVRIRPLGEPSVKEDKINIDSNANAIIRREYSAWARRHGKSKNEKRFDIFKKNFILQMEMNRKNGEFFLLNEYGDLTEEEYLSHLRASNKPNEKDETEMTSTNLRVSTKSGETLPPAPVKTVEDLTMEILNSMMDSSRVAIAHEEQAIKERSKTSSDEIIALSLRVEEKYLPENIYTTLLETTKMTVLHEIEAVRLQDPKTFIPESAGIFASYFDLLYNPMEVPNDSVLRPALLSAAVSSTSETTKTYLIDAIDFVWDEYSYAIDFEQSEKLY